MIATPAPPAPQSLSPNEYARQRRINVRKVHEWIESGELRAVNLKSRKAKRPLWRIPVEAIEEFERGREAVPRRRPQARVKRPVSRGNWV